MDNPVRKYGLLMDLPEDKRAGYYAQVVKALAGRASLFDRDKELLIFSSAGHREEALPVMEQYAIPWEEMELLLLPTSLQMGPTFSDFGFVSKLEHPYVYADQAAVFCLRAASAAGARTAEPDQAYAQLEEHLLGWYPAGDHTRAYVTEVQHRELMERIAAAYGCAVEWIEPVDL